MTGIAFYTFKIAVLSTLVAAVIGIPVSFFTTKRRFLGRSLILASSAVPLCVPALIVAISYVSFLGINGTANQLLKKTFALFNHDFKPFTFLYSTKGIILAQGFYNFPLITMVMTDAWSRLNPEQENGARMLGASEARIFFTITIKRLSGAIAAACIPVFLFCYFSFMIVMLFSPMGKSTLEVEIYKSISATMDLKSSALLALLETSTALVVVFIYTFVGRKSQTTSDGVNYTNNASCRLCSSPFETKFFKIAELVVFIILTLFILIFFFFPGLSVLISAFTRKQDGKPLISLYQFASLFNKKTFLTALFNTFKIGFCTGVCCSLLGFIYSVIIKLYRLQGKIFLQIIPLLPMAVSSVVISWVFGLIFHRGTETMLVVMQTLLWWPIAYRQIQNGINQIDIDTDMAATILSRNKLDQIFRIYIPSCKKVIISAFCFCFAVSAGDATLPLVLSISGFQSLALYTYRLAGVYKTNQACACGVILTLLCGTMFLLCRLLQKNKKR